MHRDSLKQLLQKYSPSSLKEQHNKEKMIRFLESHSDCFERSCFPGHFTGSAWLVNKNKTHALLMHHRKLNFWVQLGGHCDGDSNVLAVAIKEAQEESGIQGISPLSSAIFDIDIHKIPSYKETPAHYHYDIRFLLQVHSDENFVKNEESNDLMWIGKTSFDLIKECEESVKRLHQKWIEMT